MNFPTKSDLAVWCLGVASHLLLLLVLLIRRRWQRYPIFTVFVAYQNLVAPTLFLTYRPNSVELYRSLYWLSEVSCFVLEVAVSVEMFIIIWRFAAPVARIPWASFLRLTVFSLLIASFGAFAVGSPTLSLLDLMAMKGEIFTSFLLSGCFLGISLQANAFRLRRARHTMLIGWGLTGIAVLELSEDFRFFTQGWHGGNDIFDRAESILYACIVLYWTVGMWRTDTVKWPRPRPLSLGKAMSR